ncbi:hypothetical protein CCACVL1_30005 [Corchorus capsularis]|uniref:Uncharacterized protein n=1 Tax=Corchorus capsularis TaxID=210143 RepID=A0A1R3FZ44_COCAP|nr:hypothetical protein CCACVL1_30005 [Corchorus capsularis]
MAILLACTTQKLANSGVNIAAPLLVVAKNYYSGVCTRQMTPYRNVIDRDTQFSGISYGVATNATKPIAVFINAPGDK